MDRLKIAHFSTISLIYMYLNTSDLKGQRFCTESEQQMPLLSSVIKHATLYNVNSSLSIIFRLS